MDPGTIEPTDAALVHGALEDDGEAFTQLYRRFYPRIVRLVARKTGDPALAEDVAQDAILRALDKLDTFDPARPVWPWLRTIATNLAVDAGRKRSREVEWDPEDSAGTPVGDVSSCEDGIVLAQVLASLPDRQRAAMSLRYVEDWESSEAASFLGLSIPAFEQLLFRARRRARREYGRIGRRPVAEVLPRQANRGSSGEGVLSSAAARPAEDSQREVGKATRGQDRQDRRNLDKSCPQNVLPSLGSSDQVQGRY